MLPESYIGRMPPRLKHKSSMPSAKVRRESQWQSNTYLLEQVFEDVHLDPLDSKISRPRVRSSDCLKSKRSSDSEASSSQVSVTSGPASNAEIKLECLRLPGYQLCTCRDMADKHVSTGVLL